MSEKLTPEQIAAITKAVETHLQTTGQNQVSTQQLLPELLAVLNALPTFLTNLIAGPGGAAVTLLATIINTLISALTGVTGPLAGSNLAPQLVNIIQKQIPTQNQAAPPEQK